MNYKKNIYSLILIIAISCGLRAQTSQYKLYETTAELTKISPDTCILKCVVLDEHSCVAGAQCKPCIGDHLKVTDALNKSKIMVKLVVTNPGQYVRGEVYSFLIKLNKTDHKHVKDAVVIKEIR